MDGLSSATGRKEAYTGTDPSVRNPCWSFVLLLDSHVHKHQGSSWLAAFHFLDSHTLKHHGSPWLAAFHFFRLLLFSLTPFVVFIFKLIMNQWWFPVKEFCVLKILCYCNKDIQHGFMSDSRLETFENHGLEYFWGMFQRTTVTLRSEAELLSHQPVGSLWFRFLQEVQLLHVLDA